MPRIAFAAAVLSSILLSGAAGAQAATKPIQDNSFLIEEAYNQETGVVQHVSLFQRAPGGSYNYSFTQEWPLGGPRHQLSYTLAYLSNRGTGAGIGDVRLNYRFGLLGDGDAPIAIAPRVTAVLPTGDYKKGLGLGGAGIEALVPASIVLNDQLVAHLNAGLSWISGARDATGAKANATSWVAGGSMVWLAHPNVNLLVEALHVNEAEVIGKDRTQRVSSTTLAPGVRWAWNFSSGLQVVPGIALPVDIGNGNDVSLLLYLSLEHSFLK